MEHTDIQANTDKLCKFIATKFEANELDNSSLVQIFEVMGSYLNLQTISDYAKSHGFTYNGVIKTRTIKEIFGVKFVIDNE